MSFNKVILSGRLTSEPEVKANPAGLLICNFSLAVNDFIKGAEYTSFINCIAFAKTAEILQQHVKKGSLIGVEGALRQSRWEDQTGGKRSKIEVIVNRIEIFEWKNKEGSSDYYSKPQAAKESKDDQGDFYYGDDSTSDFIEEENEIPF